MQTYLEEKFSVSVKTTQEEASGVYCLNDWPDFEQYRKIREKYQEGSAPVFVTLHDKGYSVYLPDKKQIVIEN